MNAPSYYNLDHRALAYRWSHGPCAHPLVVIHGLGDSAIHTNAPRFANTSLRHTTSLFIDLPGFGEGSATSAYPSTLEAMADDVASLLSLLDVEDAPIFAHSMGANIAIRLGVQHPKLVRNLILAEPLLDPANSVLAAGIARYSEEAFTTRGYGMLVRATSLQAHRGEKAAEAFLPTLRQANPIALHRAAISLLRDRQPTFVEILRQLPLPTTVLLGERSEAEMPLFQREGISVKHVKDAGHFLMVEAAESTACAILEAVNGVQYGGNCG